MICRGTMPGFVARLKSHLKYNTRAGHLSTLDDMTENAETAD